MKAEIITIGDEILIGQIVNTNATWIANSLTKIGIECISIRTIRDLHEDIIETLESSLNKVDLIIMTGGLGPTNDDLTKKSLCKYFKDSLVLNQDVLDDIISFFKNKGKEDILDLNKEQALVPSKSKVIRNKLGTAPGLWFTHFGKDIIAFPGVPYEMKALMNQFLINFQEKNDLPHIVKKTIFVRNIAESKLAFMLNEWESNIHKEIKLAYLPSPGLVRLRLSCSGADKFFLEKIIKIELGKLSNFVEFDNEKLNLSQMVFDFFINNNITLSVAESCTSGLIAAELASFSGSSKYFKGGVIAYNNEIKRDILDIHIDSLEEYSEVSKEVVMEMASNVSKQFKSDFSIATSGYAGPLGGTTKNPVGTVFIAVKSLDNIISKKYLFSGDRKLILQQACNKSLEMLLDELKKYQYISVKQL